MTVGRFNEKRWSPVKDSSPGYRTEDPKRVVLNVAYGDPWVAGLASGAEDLDYRPRLGCPCGCGEYPLGPKAVFKMGHDARLRGKLIRAHLQGVEILWLENGRGPEDCGPDSMVGTEGARVAAVRYGWTSYLDSAVLRREGRNREVLARAIGSRRLITVGRWEYTGQVAAVYRVDNEDYYEVEYVNKAGDVKRARVTADSTMPAFNEED